MGAFYYTLGDINPKYQSSTKAIQLLCLCKTTDIKKYDIDAVLQPFITDLHKLEQVQVVHCPLYIVKTNISTKNSMI